MAFTLTRGIVMNITRYFSSAALCVGLVVIAGCGGGGSGGGGGGTPPVPPAIVTQPASLSVVAGAPAVFAVTATGDAPLSYQWKRDGVPIAGAATAAYTIAATASADDGASFIVEVSNPSGSSSSAAATLSVTVTATATAKSWGPAVMLSTGDVRGMAIGPQVAIDTAGNAIGVWQESLGAAIRTAVWARRYVAGTGWSAATTIDDSVGASALPQLAMAPGGVAVASFLHGTQNGSTRMIANRFDGTAWAGGLRLDLLDGVIDSDHCLAIAPNGAAALVFNQSDNVAGRRATAALSTAAGAWAAPEVIGDAGSQAPQVAIAANGDAVMVWLVGDTGTTSSLWASRRSGPFWSAPVRVVASVKGMASPRLRVDAAGNAIAVWVERPTPRNEVHAARFTASTGSWSAPSMLNDAAAQAYEPELAMTNAGDAIVVWTEASDAGQATGIGANRYLAATAAWSGATHVQPAGTSAGVLPHVALDGTGNSIAIWLQGAVGDATRLELWAASFSAQAARWASPTKLMTDPTAHTEGGESQAPQIALNAGGDAVVVWVQRTDAAPEPSVWAVLYR
jgi:hypothetical protein